MHDFLDHLKDILKSLGETRRIFHSEADFQHALAWKIHTKFKGCEIRLERPYEMPSGSYHLDLLVILDSGHPNKIGVELKYLKKQITTEDDGEEYRLSNHGAQSDARYRFFKDISRLNELKASKNIDEGYAIILTNDPIYWKQPQSTQKWDYDAFKIHDRHKSDSGELNWVNEDNNAHKNMPKLFFSKRYEFSWVSYSDVPSLNDTNGKFQYLMVKV